MGAPRKGGAPGTSARQPGVETLGQLGASGGEAIGQLAAAAVERFGRLDVWINNAAVGAIGRFEDIPIEDHARVVDVNLKGVIYGSHAALRRFRGQGHGTLVNVASVEGRVPLAYHASYAATKHAVLGLGAALNQEMRLGGTPAIKVSSVLPWAVDTPFWDNTANYSGGTPRMYLMDGPWEVVDAIVWASIHPTKEYAVGWKAKGAVFGDRGGDDAIPYALADASPLANEPLAEVFLKLLELPVSRFGLHEVPMVTLDEAVASVAERLSSRASLGQGAHSPA